MSNRPLQTRRYYRTPGSCRACGRGILSPGRAYCAPHAAMLDAAARAKISPEKETKMTQLNARLILHGPAYSHLPQLPAGTLTTGHPASSYGQPVLLIGDDPTPHGPGDLPPGTFLNIWPVEEADDPDGIAYDSDRQLIQAARDAGFQVAIAHAL